MDNVPCPPLLLLPHCVFVSCFNKLKLSKSTDFHKVESRNSKQLQWRMFRLVLRSKTGGWWLWQIGDCKDCPRGRDSQLLTTTSTHTRWTFEKYFAKVLRWINPWDFEALTKTGAASSKERKRLPTSNYKAHPHHHILKVFKCIWYL